MALDEKIQEAKAVLQLGADMSAYYYHEPLIICYSGGKDSDVMLDIAKRCLKPSEFEVMNSHTTVDAPETVYHIREVFAECEKQGIKTRISYPTYKGKRITMWQLIPIKGIPPTRVMRYCCDVLKEQNTPNRLIAVGVREDESSKRQGRDAFASLGSRATGNDWRSLQHTYAMFKIDQLGKEDAYECKFIQSCKAKKDTLSNPIYKFTERDIWDYVKQYEVPMNPLYSKGYKRVGCVGCPLGGRKHQLKEFEDYPKYKAMYIRAFDRMLEERKRKGLPILKYEFESGEEVFRWWLGYDPNQVRIEDILKEGENT